MEEKSKKRTLRYSKWIGFLGFLGFKGFSYFITKNAGDLYYFMYFSFFGYFFLSKINVDINDELYIENDRKSKAFIGNLSIILLSIISILMIFVPNVDLKPFVAAIFVILLLSYSIKFYLLER